MKRYQITLDGRTFDIRLLSDPLQEHVEVEVDGRRFSVRVESAEAGEETIDASWLPDAAPEQVAPASVAEAAAPSGNRVTAPLPGVIKSIAVRPGHRVSTGDELLVIDAMKMDNVIRASREATVETIHVTEGHQVAYGELLLDYGT
jgi:3-methylcrotonyl-CoA carboxylase alpha subunit